MTKSDEFVDSFVEFIVDSISDDEDVVVSKFKSELNLLGFSPSDELVAMVIPIDQIGKEDEEEEEDEVAGFWGDDDEKEEDEEK